MTVFIRVSPSKTRDGRVACALVRYGPRDGIEEIIAPREVKETFSAHERRLCRARARVDSWAGRFAAKLAVLRALELDERDVRLSEMEIVPRPWRACRDPIRCRMGHPPAVRLSPRLESITSSGFGVAVSISHDRGCALATAARVPS